MTVKSRATYVDRMSGRTIPWGNGGGASRELFLRDHPAKPGKLLYRMSTTDIVGSSPFSAYPGCKRTITLLSGGSFTLDFGGKPASHTMAPFAPFDFSGGWTTCCRLDGPRAHVLNVMTDDQVSYSWRTFALDGKPVTVAIEKSASLLYCAQGDVRVESEAALPTGQLLPGEMLAIEEGGGSRIALSSSTSARLLFFVFDIGFAAG